MSLGVGLITRRSLVQILPPPPTQKARNPKGFRAFCVVREVAVMADF